ncbi:hypothetical protein J2Z32_002568 [Paenibacillus turicensis]|uniref:Uncharacterized protein n=1 Tax=Paenibacillus turicensis TaxID=160487 RepID=A0ABS4FTQ1_9BACL|nr:hypothetical protein [Paenibacillus turicensis]
MVEKLASAFKVEFSSNKYSFKKIERLKPLSAPKPHASKLSGINYLLSLALAKRITII